MLAKDFINRFIEMWKECSYDGTFVTSHGTKEVTYNDGKKGISEGIKCNVSIVDNEGNYYEVDYIGHSNLMGCGCPADVEIVIKRVEL